MLLAEDFFPNEGLPTDITENSTSTEALSPHKVWEFHEGEYNGFYASVHFETPTGFKIRMDGTHPCLELLSALSLRHIQIKTDEGSRYDIRSDGAIILIDTDKWVNPDFQYGDVICYTHQLAWALKAYLKLKVFDGKSFRDSGRIL